MKFRRLQWIWLALMVVLAGVAMPKAEAQTTRTWPVLSSGQTNENVVTLQAKLRYRGYTVNYNGTYDSSTVAAVQAFERANGLNPDGVADGAVWERLVVTVRQGDNNIVVQALQRQLLYRYGYTRTITTADGIFGPATYNATRSFQLSNYIGDDGIAGANTWSRLTTGDGARISHATAISRLSGTGITVTSSAGTTPHGASGVGSDRWLNKTSLEQVRNLSITRLIEFRNAIGCNIVITGGTETWIHTNGATSHHTGYKIDIGLGTCADSYIRNNYTQIDSVRWRDVRGNVYYYEGDHWDITYTA
ncbi:MAG TPA: peptidoglycan-binding protein [Herpetosiphonaceae bacterium]